MSYVNKHACKSVYCRQFHEAFGGNENLLPMDDIPAAVMASRAGKSTQNLSCAVVSSSDRMDTHNHGADINSHDLVMRFNNARVAGYEKFVGNRTDILVVNSIDRGYPLVNVPGVVKILMKMHKDPMEAPAQFSTFIERRRAKPQESLHALNTEFLQFVSNLVLMHSRPSTGITGVVMALQFCGVVDVYEIAPSSAPSKGFHYWNYASIKYYRTAGLIKPTGEYCPHDCESERNWLLAHNEYDRNFTAKTGIVRLVPAKHPSFRFSGKS